ncbi:MAG TPA: class I SAM-dependent methyltransferase [Opitutaceae bacterium]|nr:class I SAM-dependent methyltransferase [Opitutaceae bacterium]
MPLIDHVLGSARLRKALWKFWYPFLTRRLRADDVLLLNYAFEEEPPLAIPLDASDEPNRPCLQLYHHVVSQTDLRGKDVLEVSCGHGGGASYVMRRFQPRRYTGLDLNPEGIAFCRQRHRIEGLDFVQGDAETLPFANESFDAVVNVEASHCYPSLPRFLSEVSRVLRPGGHLLYADFRFASGVAEWEQDLATSPLVHRKTQKINAEVLRGLDLNSARSLGLITRHLPSFLHSLGRDFAGVRGSRVYNALQSDALSYRSYHFEKANLPR